MKYYISIFYLLIAGLHTTMYAQVNADSLELVLSKTTTPTTELGILLSLIDELEDSNHHLSKKYAFRAFDLATILGDEEKLLQTAMILSRLYIQRSNWDSSQHWANEALGLSQKLEDTQQECKALRNLGLIEEKIGSLSEALRFYEDAMKVAPDDETKLPLYNNMGIAYKQAGRLETAIASFQQGMEVAERLKNKQAQAIISNNIGDIHLILHNYKKAEDYFKQSLILKEDLEDERGKLFAMGNLIRLYTQQVDSINVAERLAIQAIQIADKVRDPFLQAGFQFEMARISDLKGNNQQSLKYANNALQIGEEANIGNIKLAQFYNFLAASYLKSGQGKLALENGQKALKFAEQTQREIEIQEVRKNLAAIYKEQGNHKKAYEYASTYYELNEHIKNDAAVQKMARLDAQLADVEKEKKIALLEKDAKIQEIELQRQRNFTTALAIGFVLLLGVAYLFSRLLLRIRKSNQLLTDEKKRSDDLLGNILPSTVIEELKTTGKVAPRRYETATVLFTDFKNFTEVTTRISPAQLVEKLDICFKAFDDIISKYQIEKIKTIGDSYMCVSGLPETNPNHAIDIVKAAIEMQAFVTENPLLKDTLNHMRIGINSGPVISGMVGKKKYAFDIWGEGVNLAARMETNCQSGQINLSANTYRLLSNQIEVEYHGDYQEKDGDEVGMYYVKVGGLRRQGG